MNLLQQRLENANAILENRFVRRTLEQTALDINNAQTKFMASRGFNNENWFSGRSFNVTNNAMNMTVLKKHRFVDMKTITTKKGRHNKKNHPVYNKIVWGHYNNVVRELAYGFTDAVKAEISSIKD